MNSIEAIIRLLAACGVVVAASLWWLRRRPAAARDVVIHLHVGDQPSRITRISPQSGEVSDWPEEEASRGPVGKPVRFLVDALLLIESFRYVCGPDWGAGQRERAGRKSPINGFKESFHYATGMKADEQTYVVTRLIPVGFSRQSAVGVRVADRSNIEALAALDRAGLPLLMHFHSHPGFGREANYPSAVDRAFQERLERGGHIAVGAIFSRSGHVRFFAGDLDRFVVEVAGQHVRKVGDNEFELQLGDDDVQRQALAAG